MAARLLILENPKDVHGDGVGILQQKLLMKRTHEQAMAIEKNRI